MADISMHGSDAITVETLAGPKKRARKEAIIRSIFFFAASVSVLISVLIVGSLVKETWTFVTEVDWSVTWGEIGWFPRQGLYDMPTLLPDHWGLARRSISANTPASAPVGS